MPDQFNMSGDFQGAVINIKSTLNNVQQSVGALPAGDPSDRVQLTNLIQQLSDALQKIPAEQQEYAQALAETTQALVNAAKDQKPNKTLVQISGDGLLKAAQNLAKVAPLVLPLASQIVETVTRLIAAR
jgi:hypothetical protein